MECRANACVRAAVAHCDKYIVLTQLDIGFEYLFAADYDFAHGVIIYLTVAQHDDLRVVILDQLDGRVINNMDYCEC